jgi:hypothetical protein
VYRDQQSGRGHFFKDGSAQPPQASAYSISFEPQALSFLVFYRMTLSEKSATFGIMAFFY